MSVPFQVLFRSDWIPDEQVKINGTSRCACQNRFKVIMSRFDVLKIHLFRLIIYDRLRITTFSIYESKGSQKYEFTFL